MPPKRAGRSKASAAATTAPNPSASASAAKKPKTAGKRGSLHENITRIFEGGDEVLFDLMAEFEAMPTHSYLRVVSLGYQRRQDEHLHLYRRYICLMNKLPEDTPEEDIDAVGFPENVDHLLKLVKFFMIFVFKNALPSDKDAKYIQYSTLAMYRDTMLFWVDRIYRQREVDPPNKSRIFNTATEGMRLAHQTYGSKERRRVKRYVSIGLEELRNLLDLEIANAVFIDNSEQHQVIWCILRQTAVRPGSIGRNRDREVYLMWRNIEFTRNPNERAKFTCRISFENLKTNPDDPERALRQGGHRVLDCYLDSPNSENIIFSVPHRLLVIALRRKLLVGINTIDELLQGDRYNIQVSGYVYKQSSFQVDTRLIDS